MSSCNKNEAGLGEGAGGGQGGGRGRVEGGEGEMTEKQTEMGGREREGQTEKEIDR